MKGRLLSKYEVAQLKDGIKVWVEDKDGILDSKIHVVNDWKLVDDNGRYWNRNNTHTNAMVYEWMEEKEMDKRIGRELSVEEIENLELGTKVWMVSIMVPNGQLREVKENFGKVLRAVEGRGQCGATGRAMHILNGRVYEWIDEKERELTTLYNKRMELGEKLDKLKAEERETERQIIVLLGAEEILRATGGTK